MVTRKKTVRSPWPSPHPEAHPEQRLRRSPRKKSAAQLHLARQEDAERMSRLNATKVARLFMNGGSTPAASAAASPREDSDAGKGKDEDGDVVGKHEETVLIERTSSLSSKVDEDTDCRHAGVSPPSDLVEEQHTCYGLKKPLPIQVASSLNPKDGVDGSTSNDSFNSTDVVAVQRPSTGGMQSLLTEQEVTIIESSPSPSSEVDHDADWSHIDSFDVATQRITFSEKQPLPTHDGSGNETSASSNSFDSNDAASAQHGSYGSKQLPPLNDDSGHEASDLGNSFESTGTDVASHHITSGLKQPLTLQMAGDGSDANTSSSSYAPTVVAPYHKPTGLKRLTPTYISSDAPLTTNAAEDHVQDSTPSSLPPVVVTPPLSAYIIHDDEDSEVDDQAKQILRDITRMVRTPANILGVDYPYKLRPYVWECLAVCYSTRSSQVLQSDFEDCMNLIGMMKALEGSGKGFRITVTADGVAEMYNENEQEWEELERKAKYGEECRAFAALMDVRVERWEMLEEIRRLFDENYRLEDKDDEGECSLVILGSPKLVVRNAAEEEKQILRDIAALARNEQYAASGQTYNLTASAWKMIKDHNQRHPHSSAEIQDLFKERIHLFVHMQELNNRAGFVVDEDRGCIQAEARLWRALDKAENGHRKLACLKGKSLKNYGLFAEILEAFHHTYDARRRGDVEGDVEEWPQDVHLVEGKGQTQQLQDGCGPPVCAGEYKRRDSRAAAPLFALDPTPTPTPQKDAFEGEVTQAELNVEALRLSYAPPNGETTPEFLIDPIGYGFTLDEAHSCFAKMAEYTSNLSALKQVKAGSGHWFKADVMGALKKQFGDKDVWRLLERNQDNFDMLSNKYGIQVPDEEMAKFMSWQEFATMARNLDAYEGLSHPKRIAEVNNNMRAQEITFREIQIDGGGFGFKADEARKFLKLLISIVKEEKLGPASKSGTCDFHPRIWSAVAASLPGRTDMDCQLFYERSRHHLNMIVNNGGDGRRFPYFDDFEEIERLIHAHLKAEVTRKRKRVQAQADRMIEQTTTGSKRSFVEVEEPKNHQEDTGSRSPPHGDRNEDTPEANQPPCQKRQTRHGDDFSFANYQGRSNALFRAAESFHESFKASTEQLKRSIDKRSADFMAELRIQAEQIRARNTLFQNRHVEFTRVLTERSHAFNKRFED